MSSNQQRNPNPIVIDLDDIPSHQATPKKVPEYREWSPSENIIPQHPQQNIQSPPPHRSRPRIINGNLQHTVDKNGQYNDDNDSRAKRQMNAQTDEDQLNEYDFESTGELKKRSNLDQYLIQGRLDALNPYVQVQQKPKQNDHQQIQQREKKQKSDQIQEQAQEQPQQQPEQKKQWSSTSLLQPITNVSKRRIKMIQQLLAQAADLKDDCLKQVITVQEYKKAKKEINSKISFLQKNQTQSEQSKSSSSAQSAINIIRYGSIDLDKQQQQQSKSQRKITEYMSKAIPKQQQSSNQRASINDQKINSKQSSPYKIVVRQSPQKQKRQQQSNFYKNNDIYGVQGRLSNHQQQQMDISGPSSAEKNYQQQQFHQMMNNINNENQVQQHNCQQIDMSGLSSAQKEISQREVHQWSQQQQQQNEQVKQNNNNNDKEEQNDGRSSRSNRGNNKDPNLIRKKQTKQQSQSHKQQQQQQSSSSEGKQSKYFIQIEVIQQCQNESASSKKVDDPINNNNNSQQSQFIMNSQSQQFNQSSSKEKQSDYNNNKIVAPPNSSNSERSVQGSVVVSKNKSENEKQVDSSLEVNCTQRSQQQKSHNVESAIKLKNNKNYSNQRNQSNQRNYSNQSTSNHAINYDNLTNFNTTAVDIDIDVGQNMNINQTKNQTNNKDNNFIQYTSNSIPRPFNDLSKHYSLHSAPNHQLARQRSSYDRHMNEYLSPSSRNNDVNSNTQNQTHEQQETNIQSNEYDTSTNDFTTFQQHVMMSNLARRGGSQIINNNNFSANSNNVDNRQQHQQQRQQNAISIYRVVDQRVDNNDNNSKIGSKNKVIRNITITQSQSKKSKTIYLNNHNNKEDHQGCQQSISSKHVVQTDFKKKTNYQTIHQSPTSEHLQEDKQKHRQYQEKKQEKQQDKQEQKEHKSQQSQKQKIYQPRQPNKQPYQSKSPKQNKSSKSNKQQKHDNIIVWRKQQQQQPLRRGASLLIKHDIQQEQLQDQSSIYGLIGRPHPAMFVLQKQYWTEHQIQNSQSQSQYQSSHHKLLNSQKQLTSSSKKRTSQRQTQQKNPKQIVNLEKYFRQSQQKQKQKLQQSIRKQKQKQKQQHEKKQQQQSNELQQESSRNQKKQIIVAKQPKGSLYHYQLVQKNDRNRLIQVRRSGRIFSKSKARLNEIFREDDENSNNEIENNNEIQTNDNPNTSLILHPTASRKIHQQQQQSTHKKPPTTSRKLALTRTQQSNRLNQQITLEWLKQHLASQNQIVVENVYMYDDFKAMTQKDAQIARFLYLFENKNSKAQVRRQDDKKQKLKRQQQKQQQEKQQASNNNVGINRNIRENNIMRSSTGANHQKLQQQSHFQHQAVSKLSKQSKQSKQSKKSKRSKRQPYMTKKKLAKRSNIKIQRTVQLSIRKQNPNLNQSQSQQHLEQQQIENNVDYNQQPEPQQQLDHAAEQIQNSISNKRQLTHEQKVKFFNQNKKNYRVPDQFPLTIKQIIDPDILNRGIYALVRLGRVSQFQLGTPYAITPICEVRYARKKHVKEVVEHSRSMVPEQYAENIALVALNSNLVRLIEKANLEKANLEKEEQKRQITKNANDNVDNANDNVDNNKNERQNNSRQDYESNNNYSRRKTG